MNVVLLNANVPRRRYHIHNWDPMNPNMPGEFCMFVKEESDGCERIRLSAMPF
jgi:hypothetical protein